MCKSMSTSSYIRKSRAPFAQSYSLALLAVRSEAVAEQVQLAIFSPCLSCLVRHI